MVEIGDHANLSEGATIQGHSLEEGLFKSDRIRIGSGCTIGSGALVHYGVTMGDNVVLEPDSFLMKGESPDSGTTWRGNPARSVRRDARRSKLVEVALPEPALAAGGSP
jgi:non-ribosomal peptide synthetase-like protein